MLRQFIATICLILLLPMAAAAQVTSLLPSQTTDTSSADDAPMSQLLQEAANTGMQVIILQPDGSSATVNADGSASSQAQTNYR